METTEATLALCPMVTQDSFRRKEAWTMVAFHQIHVLATTQEGSKTAATGGNQT